MTTIVPNEKASSNGSAKSQDVRTGNILAARAVADAVRTSLGPKGMDKMIQQQNGEVLITNDGATIVKQMEVIHPAAKMMVELSHAQDVEAGDGTTTVVVMAGALLQASQQLLAKGIHPTVVSESLKKAARKSEEVLKGMATEVNIGDREQLIKSASTSLNSKVVSQYSSLLAPLAVDACLKVLQPGSFNLDLNNIKIVKKLGGTIDDTRLVEGLVFTQKAAKSAGGPTRVEKAKIALIQFCLSAPKSNMENQVIVSDFRAMDRAIRQEKEYIANLVRQIKKSGCNVLLVQKSILRDAVNDLSLAFLAAAKILLVKDVERDDIDFIAKTVGATPIASIEGFAAEKLGSAELVEELSTADGKLVQVTGVPNPGRTVTVLCRGSNKLVLDEADRSIHDALCVIRSLVKERYLLAGGGAPEIEISLQLGAYAKTLAGNEQFCIRAFAESLEIIPYTLAENAGLNPIAIVTELRNKHAEGNKTAGINVRKGTISNILEEDVIQPLLVTLSAIKLSSEAVAMLLKIDDIVACR